MTPPSRNPLRPRHAAVHAATRELLATGNLSDEGFKAAEQSLGPVRLAEIVHTIGHFSTTALMANAVGAVEDPIPKSRSETI